MSSLSFSKPFSRRRGLSRIVSGTSTSASPMNSSYLPTWSFSKFGNMSPVIRRSCSTSYCGTKGVLASMGFRQSSGLLSRPTRCLLPTSLSMFPLPISMNNNVEIKMVVITYCLLIDSHRDSSFLSSLSLFVSSNFLNRLDLFLS